MLKLFDTHTHLDSPEFDTDREAVILRAQEAGIAYMLTVGVGGGLASARRIMPLLDRYEFIWGSVGVHPHDAGMELDIESLGALALHPKVLAIGETGLDFFREWSPRARQHEWFRAQIELARKVGKPLIIHSRSAGSECLQVLKEQRAEEVGGVFHCFSEDKEFAAKLLAINFLISVPGTVTFKKAQTLQEAVRALPLDRILLETDAPYLAPVPYRGQRCESGFMVETAKMVASLKDLSLEEVARRTTDNALRFFGLARGRG